MDSVIKSNIIQAGIPIKTKASPHGAYTELELYDILGDIYE